MAKLVFDIETSALPLQTFDEVQQEYLLRETQKIEDATARAVRREEILRQFNLWPFTAQVVCIAMLNAESLRGHVLFTADSFEADAAEDGPVEFVACTDESELLTAFWDVAKHYDEVVTFNGRGFDVPFLYLRSPFSTCRSRKRTGSVTGSPPNRTVIWRSNSAFTGSAAARAPRGALALPGPDAWSDLDRPSEEDLDLEKKIPGLIKAK